jgi:hypothetical protein
MVPPFLAYYGVVRKNTSIILEAYNQCRLYRQYLQVSRRPSDFALSKLTKAFSQDPEGSGLWRHILLGDWNEPGLWGTVRRSS